MEQRSHLALYRPPLLHLALLSPSMPQEAKMPAVRYAVEDLGMLIAENRKRQGLSLQDVANACGISKATVWRLERQHTHGEHPDLVPDTATITAVAKWIGIPPQHFFGAEVPMSEELSQEMALPDAVEAHLRADRNLDSDSAQKLGTMFRLAYEQFSRSASREDD